jgi:hypothetical protein
MDKLKLTSILQRYENQIRNILHKGSEYGVATLGFQQEAVKGILTALEPSEEKVFTQHEMNEACRIRDLQIMELTNKIDEPKSEKCECEKCSGWNGLICDDNDSNWNCIHGRGARQPLPQAKECGIVDFVNDPLLGDTWVDYVVDSPKKQWEKIKIKLDELGYVVCFKPLPEKEPRKGIKCICGEYTLIDSSIEKHDGVIHRIYAPCYIPETPKRIEELNFAKYPERVDAIFAAYNKINECIKAINLIQDRNDRVGR